MATTGAKTGTAIPTPGTGVADMCMMRAMATTAIVAFSTSTENNPGVIGRYWAWVCMVELGQTEEARRILNFYASAAEVGRSIVAPPGLAPDTVTALRRAFDAMFFEPIFLDEVKRAGIQLKPMRGDKLQTMIAEVGIFRPEFIEKARIARQKPN